MLEHPVHPPGYATDLSLPKMSYSQTPKLVHGVMTYSPNTHLKQGVHQSTSSTQPCSVITPHSEPDFKHDTHPVGKPPGS